MDLPTYTSIWRIEKRLYKLYDFRLPMPLPIGQITVFAAISVPYVVLLTVLGVPFSHSLIWLYVLPPGVATWLVTRPVLESKRLPELIRSQLRYLVEPRVWCRMAPFGESDVIVATARVWWLSATGRARLSGERASRPASPLQTPRPGPVLASPPPPPPLPRHGPPATDPGPPRPATAPGARPVVTVVNAGSDTGTPPAVERALAGPSPRRPDGRTGRVSVVPGGHRPGKPDQLQRDRARAQSPLDGHRRVVVLGCTVGAGQTVTTLLTGEVLASLRTGQIAVLDLNPGSDSLAKQAMLRPALGQAASLGPSRLTVITHEAPESGETEAMDPAVAASAFEQASATYQILLADPSTSAVTRLLAMADQLVLVAPASAAAARAIGMTFEWLDAHGQADLAADAIMVMNGVSRRSMAHVEQAERVCIGRCRAIVRIPWDDQLKAQILKRTSSPNSSSPPGQRWAGLLSPATISAAAALAGVLVTALASAEQADGTAGKPVSPGWVSR